MSLRTAQPGPLYRIANLSASAPIDPLESMRALAWPHSQLDEALRVMAQKLGTALHAGDLSVQKPPALDADGESFARWLDRTVAWLNLESEAIAVCYQELNLLLRKGAPLLLHLPDMEGEEARFLLVYRGGRQWISILAEDSKIHWVSKQQLINVLRQPLERTLSTESGEWLRKVSLSPQSRVGAEIGLFHEHLGNKMLADCWLLRLSPSLSFAKQARHAGLTSIVSLSVLLQILQAFCFVIGWGMVAQAGQQGWIEWWLLLAGLLLWFSSTPFALGRLAVDKMFVMLRLADVLRQRLLYGVLRLHRDEMQQHGTGQFLAWVLEANALEEAGRQSQTTIIFAGITLLMTALLLALIGDLLAGLLLIVWLAITVVLGWRLVKHHSAVKDHTVAMTSDFLERVQGHATRLVQENDWYGEDDQAMAHFVTLSRRFAQRFLRMWVLIPDGWLLLGFIGVSSSFVWKSGHFAAQGVRLTALLYSYQQFRLMITALLDLLRAFDAWRLLSPIYQAAEQPQQPACEQLSSLQRQMVQTRQIPLLETRGLTFRYPNRQRPVLHDCNLQIHVGDRILLQGASGGGKSTLAALLIGLERPESGLLFLCGLDRHSLNEDAWRRIVVAAPQFHENHLLNSTFAFNLLMGRQRTPTVADLEEAEALCYELGLGELLQRMPLGLLQPVGEQGWRLSHGERSRVYIARALLQQADVIILDESFASLDPGNMQIAFECVLKHAPTLLMIAHP